VTFPIHGDVVGSALPGPAMKTSTLIATTDGSRKRRIGWVQVAPYLFALPFLLVFCAFVIAPFGYAGYLSLFKTAMVGGERFVGLSNYWNAFGDANFWNGLLNCLIFGLIMTPVMLTLALAAGLVLDSKVVRAGSFFKVGIFLPYAIPGVIGTLLWGFLYGREYGLISQTLGVLGITPPHLLGNQLIIASLANISIWQYLGYNFVILYAAMAAVPDELTEAAVVDGASATQIAWQIKIPMIRSAIIVVVLFAIIGTIQLFNEPFLLMPMASDVITSDFTPNVYTFFLAFRTMQYNYAGAISFVMGLITAVVSIAFLVISRRREE